MPLISGEDYEAQYRPNSHVFLMLIDGRWAAWRETWRDTDESPHKGKSVSQKVITEREISFEAALKKASRYLTYVSRR
ncbi:hypothetical protein DQG13_27555 [Paenibacillus sp. YN15]|nr:hypothetical protein DQG13_27555 [Paenibacillus sp. YN15]